MHTCRIIDHSSQKEKEKKLTTFWILVGSSHGSKLSEVDITIREAEWLHRWFHAPKLTLFRGGRANCRFVVRLLVTYAPFSPPNSTRYRVESFKQWACYPEGMGPFERLASQFEPCPLHDTNVSRPCYSRLPEPSSTIQP
jgi:hypothetical protein